MVQIHQLSFLPLPPLTGHSVVSRQRITTKPTHRMVLSSLASSASTSSFDRISTIGSNTSQSFRFRITLDLLPNNFTKSTAVTPALLIGMYSIPRRFLFTFISFAEVTFCTAIS
uniref:Uncharacterized protein n=1 Tax=Opuntia streptacantha TaxID=393608 RepID=A0A7C9DWU3_OPUST